MHCKTKHIPIKYDFIREQVIENVINFKYLDTNKHIMDIFIKPLPIETLEYLRRKLGVVYVPQ